MTTEAFDLTEYGDMYVLAVEAKLAGFQQVLIDPAHAIAMIDELARLTAENKALRDVFTKRVATGAEVFGSMVPGETIPDFLKRLEEPADPYDSLEDWGHALASGEKSP